jgi:two-component system chemotaxis response regulator CheB
VSLPGLHVLVVDDSAVARQILAAILSADGSIAVTTAADPLIALRKMERSRPDVIVLDLEMPRMDGLTFLRRIMSEDPIPVVVCSGHAERGTAMALTALSEGAVEVIARPRVAVREFLQESAVLLLDAVRAAAQARLGPRRTAPPADPAPSPPPPPAARSLPAHRVVVLGSSTGGVEALHQILGALPGPPALVPPIVLVQHMPEGFTAAFAHRLNEACRVEVREAADGDLLRPGLALVAPGNRHTRLRPVRQGCGYAVEVIDGPLISRHRPSVDVLFRSAAEAAGPAGVGIVLTGMGSDGAAGLLAMRQAGAETFAQSEDTCVVFGMPKEAIAAGAVEQVLPLGSMAGAVLGRRRGNGH